MRHSNLGNAPQFLERLDQAITSFQKSLVINPNSLEVLNVISYFHQGRGKP